MSKIGFHQPVLLEEVIEALQVKRGGFYIDATVGGGGHAEAVLKEDGHLLGIDTDPEAVKAARARLVSACPPSENYSWRLVQGNFRELAKIARENDFKKVDGVLFDLGISSYQLSRPERGFSFNLSGPLDMRMSPDLGVTAADLVNSLPQKQLADLFYELADEEQGRKLARQIVLARQEEPIQTTHRLVEIVKQVVGSRQSKLHPATKIFMALRMAVNEELPSLAEALKQAVELLKTGGRLVVISFHSKEDRLVKRFLQEGLKKDRLKLVSKKPIQPTQKEIDGNPRARSAKMRVVEKK